MAGHKEYEFNCESQHERTLLALGLRAATARLAKHPSMVGKGGLLRLAVPAKPLGFLNAALTERNVAFPEPFRYAHPAGEQGARGVRRVQGGLAQGAPPAADAGDASPAGTPCTCVVARQDHKKRRDAPPEDRGAEIRPTFGSCTMCHLLRCAVHWRGIGLKLTQGVGLRVAATAPRRGAPRGDGRQGRPAAPRRA